MIYQLIYPLADVLQLDLQVFKSGSDFEIKGGREFRFPMSKGVGADRDLVFKTKIEASSIRTNDSFLLLHIKKNLYVFLSYTQGSTESDDIIEMNIIDANKTNIKTLKNAIDNQDLSTAMMAINPVTVASFFKGIRDVKWQAVHLGGHKLPTEGGDTQTT